MRDLGDSKLEYMEETLEKIYKKYHSIYEYMNKLGFTNEQVKEAEVFSKEHIIVGLPNSSAIRIEDKQIEYIGKCYIFKNGVMTTLNDKYEKNK